MIWQLVAMVIAVRAALDYKTTGKAVIVCLIGWVAYVVAVFVLGSIFGVSMAMS
jgi:H+/gluconate symporter-like permease